MKISIIGVGKVGSTIGFSIVMKALASELVLVSRTKQRTYGEALDLQHAAALSPGRIEVRSGALDATENSQIVILTLSASPPAHRGGAFDRLALAEPNAKLFGSIVPSVARLSPDAILLVVSNPVDILTYAALKLSRFDPRRVFGTGTLIDSARFRSCLSSHFGIHADDIRAYILGEHGNSQFPVLSAATAGGWSMGNDPEVKQAFHDTSQIGHEVTNTKGYTNFAVASAATMIVEAIQTDANRTMPVSTLVDGYLGIHDVCLSLPAVIGRDGVAKILALSLSTDEQGMLARSASRLGESLQPLKELWGTDNDS